MSDKITYSTLSSAIIEPNTVHYKAENAGDINSHLKFGGSDGNKFVPNLNSSFFNDEFFINFNRKDKIITDEKAILSNGKLSQKVGDDIDEYYFDANNKLKWDIVWNSNPNKTKIEWDIECSDSIEFLPMSRDLMPPEWEMPDEADGSYSIWINKWGDKYGSGKICHVFRPLLIDVNNNKQYATIEIKNKKLTISLPKAFMDSAVYPVRLDPTIGYTSVGAASDGTDQLLQGINYNNTAASNGTATKVYFYLKSDGSSRTALLGFYDDSGGNPNALVDGNKSVTVASATPTWYSADVTGTITSGSKYYPGYLGNNGGANRCYIYGDAGSSGDNKYIAGQTTMPDPFGAATNYNIRISGYIDYTESGASSAVPKIMLNMNQFNGGMK